MGKRYMVVDEYITAKTATPDGTRLVGFYRGAVLPDDVPEETIKHHLLTEQIEEIDGELDTSFEDKRVSDFAGEGGGIPETGSAQPEPKKAATAGDGTAEPRKSAPKEDWVEYAVSQGADREDLEEKNPTKADLIATYGSK